MTKPTTPRKSTAGTGRVPATSATRKTSGAGGRPSKTASPRPAGTKRASSSTTAAVPSSLARIRVMMILIGILFSICGVRATQIQAFDPEANAVTAADLLTVGKPIPALRGEIVDRSGEPLAVSENSVTIVADPKSIAQNGKDQASQMTDDDRRLAALAPKAISELVARYAGGAAADYLPSLTKPNSRYAVVARQVPAATWLTISQQLTQTRADGKPYRQPGIYTEPTSKRSYPGSGTGANVVGFVDSGLENKDGIAQGKGGVELALNQMLSGQAGREEYQSSPNGRIPLGTDVHRPAVNGSKVTLTLDSALQYYVDQKLAAAVKEHYAHWGVVIVQKVKTGEILALSQAPTFDPNNLSQSKTENMGIRAVTDAYEPGSVEKALTFAALIDQGLATADSTVSIPNRLPSGGGKIKDAFEHGEVTQTTRAILTHSSNIGTVLNARKSDKAAMADYLKAFGLGAKTGIGLPGEAAGLVPGAKMPDYSRDQISFGQGLSVTAVQEAAAMSAVVNGGIYNPPRIIASVTSPEGTVTPFQMPTSRRVLKPETSATMRDLLESVLTSNPANQKFQLASYRAGGKTGTAEKINPDCGCYDGKYVTSFAGFAPVEDPEILVYAVFDTPRMWGRPGAGSPLPLWKDVMEYALPRYGVLPSSTKPKTYSFKW